MYIIGIDLGTTNFKAGVYRTDGTNVAVASRPTPTHQHREGYAYYDPEEMWSLVSELLQEAMAVDPQGKIACIGITSMAESGVLLNRQTGKAQSIFMPWFDTCSQPQAERISASADLFERFTRSGLHNSFKLGMSKLLWLKDHQPDSLEDAVWISASGYIAYRLTGQFAVDYTLAARTYAFRIDTKAWDHDWIESFGLSADLFPDAYPSGAVIGEVHAEAAGVTGLTAGVPVGIGGHDHVCAALAVGAIQPEHVYDSMGTAETLVGSFEERALSRADYEAGLSFGVHIAPGKFFWMGGNSASGGSMEWLRGQLGDPPLPYEVILGLLENIEPGPSGILYYPYLSGSGAPMPDSKAKAAWIGLSKEHGRKELIQSVLEGTAYQLEAIRRCAELVSGRSIGTMRVVGGGTRIAAWLQIKADITSCRLELPPIQEATMLGAAMAAGIGAGVYASAETAAEAVSGSTSKWVEPDEERHAKYKRLYEEGYAALQEALRGVYPKLRV